MTGAERATFTATERIVELVYTAEELTTSDLQSAAGAIVADLARALRQPSPTATEAQAAAELAHLRTERAALRERLLACDHAINAAVETWRTAAQTENK